MRWHPISPLPPGVQGRKAVLDEVLFATVMQGSGPDPLTGALRTWQDGVLMDGARASRLGQKKAARLWKRAIREQGMKKGHKTQVTVQLVPAYRPRSGVDLDPEVASGRLTGEVALVRIDAGPLGQFRLELTVEPAGHGQVPCDILSGRGWRVNPKDPAGDTDFDWGDLPLGGRGDEEEEDWEDEDDDEDDDEDEAREAVEAKAEAEAEAEDLGAPLGAVDPADDDEEEEEEDEDEDEPIGSPAIVLWAFESHQGYLLAHPTAKGKTYCPRPCGLGLYSAETHPPNSECPACRDYRERGLPLPDLRRER